MSSFDSWWRIPSCGGPSTSYPDILKHTIWIGNGQDMWVTRVVRVTQIEHVIMGITVREVSRLKEGTNSFLMVYNTPYVVKIAAELWAKEWENGVEKKVGGHFLIKTGPELALPAYDIVPWTFECLSAHLSSLLHHWWRHKRPNNEFFVFFLAFFLVFTQN